MAEDGRALDPPAQRRSFHWRDARDVLAPLVGEPDLALDGKRRAFTSAHLRVELPLVLPVPADCASLADYVDRLPDEPGRHVLVLLQAGAASLGLFEGGEVRATKSLKRYVVRGRGRAQPTHLATRGKSRYGSRLRLQNARRLLEETSEKLHEWRGTHGPPDHAFYNAPVRLWPDLLRVRPAPPIDPDAALRIPYDLPRPTTEVLLRTYRRMSHGRIVSVNTGA